MSKSRDAFRTISEVSDVLDTPAHVLRFWESKFTQVKPVKRAGGRRYYRPGDVELLAGIKQLLHDDGMTIKGAQKLLREQGVKHVSGIGADILKAVKSDVPGDTVIEHKAAEVAPEPAPMEEPAPVVEVQDVQAADEEDTAKIVPLDTSVPANDPAPEPEAAPTLEPVAQAAQIDVPADPSDSDSKAPARLFHLLHKAPPEKLAAQADAIAPLLDRMRSLRSRISSR